jgi:hypothetical protein
MSNNQFIVEAQETGKTTYLFNEIERLLKEGSGIIVMDSATEHADKSLLRKVSSKYDNSCVIDLRDEKQVVLGNIDINDFINNYKNYFPFNEIMNNRDKIICFDLSYFLERGHDAYDETGDMNLYRYYRGLYNALCEQVALTIILMEREKLIRNCFVVMDEIEFPITEYTIDELEDGISFLASVHPENAFGTFYESFSRLKFQKYQMRKE